MENAKRFPVCQLRSLESRYRAIKRKVSEELKRPAPDMMRLQMLKRRSVILRDQIRELVKPSAEKMPIHG